MTGDPAYLKYYRSLRALNRRDAEAIIESYLADDGSIEGLYADVLMPAMDHVGRQWQLGRISVAHEHYISEVTRDLVSRYGPRMYANVPARGLVAVLGCVPGERHSIGLMMIGDVLRAGGLVVHALGEGLPSAAIVEFVAEVGADLIGLSCAMDSYLPDLADLIPLVRHARPGIGVAVGGLAIRFGDESMGRRLGADYHAADVREASHRLPGWVASLGHSRDQAPEFPH
jgi:methanogenic corrinoid protein MtbC1